MLKARTCQVRGSCSPGQRSDLNGPPRRCRVSPASLMKAKRPANTRYRTCQTPPELCHRPCPAGSPQVFSPNRLGGCYQVTSTLLPSQASAARTRGGTLGDTRWPTSPVTAAPTFLPSPRTSSPKARALEPALSLLSPAQCALAWTPASAAAFIGHRPLLARPTGPLPARDPCPSRLSPYIPHYSPASRDQPSLCPRKGAEAEGEPHFV